MVHEVAAPFKNENAPILMKANKSLNNIQLDESS
jgi:hypothetical protein